MDKKTKKMLELLDSQIQSCQNYNLYQNGRAKPYWTERSKYMMILEAPGKEEVDSNEVIIGKTGRQFWELMEQFDLQKSQFLILNSVNCRVLNGNKNGKPSEAHRDACRSWIRKYVKVFEPEHLLLFGNYAMHTITGEWGVTKWNATVSEETVYNINMQVIRSFHPSAMIYGGDKREMISESIKKFKSLI